MNKRTILIILALTLIVAPAALVWWWSSGGEAGGASKTDADFITVGPYQVAVTVTPSKPVVGENRLQIWVRDADDEPVEGAKVKAVGKMPAMGAMPAMYAPAEITEVEPGRYEGTFELSMEGAWPLTVNIAQGENRVELNFDMGTSRQGLALAASTPAIERDMNQGPASRERDTSGTVRVAEGRRQAIGVKTGTVKRESVALPLRLQGRLAYDESRLTDITLRFDAWIGELKITDEGQHVSRGEVLFTVYSPELLTLQEDYLRARRSGNGRLRSAARQRLERAGVTGQQLEWLAKQGRARDYFPIFSPAAGVVIEKNLVPGSAVKRGERLLRLADMSALWVEAFAYEQDLPLLETGQQARLRIDGQGSIAATVTHIDPFLQRETRTARVRLPLDNEQGHYQAGQFVQVNLLVPLGKQLVVPEDAVLVSGHKRLVFKDQGGGRLTPVPVQTGYRIDGQIVIRRGLEEGEAIVTAGTFLIASESKMKAGIDQW